jgi:nucleoside-diphosphate-sugar epimerase
MQKLLVTGALGVIGRAVVERFAARADVRWWGSRGGRRTRGSREPARCPNPVRWVSCDLRDAAATRAALAPHRDATTLVYAALYEKPELVRGWHAPDHVEVNAAMLANALAALEARRSRTFAAPGHEGLRRPHAGGDACAGARARRVRDHANFYFAQQDLLRGARRARLRLDDLPTAGRARGRSAAR